MNTTPTPTPHDKEPAPAQPPVTPTTPPAAPTVPAAAPATPVPPQVPEATPATTPAPAPVAETPAPAPETTLLPATTATVAKPPLLARVPTWVAFALGMIVSVGGWYLYQYLAAPSDGSYPEVVARVNGEEISSKDFLQSMTQTANVATSQGIDPADASVRETLEEQALTVLTNTRLLVQKAEEAGFTASEEEVNAQYETLTEQFGGEEALLAEAAKYNLSADDLRRDIKEQLVVDQYLRSEIDLEAITVSDEEIEAAYEAMTAGADASTLPPLESVSAAIEAQLAGEAQQAAIAELIESLRAEADIEVLI